MLIGRAPFARETVSDTIAAILEREPPWETLPADASAVGHLLRRCLKKDPKRRLRDIGDAIADLHPSPAAPAATHREPAGARRAWPLVTVVAIAALLAGIVVGYVVHPAATGERRTIVRSSLPLDSSIEYSRAAVTNVAWSPDGTLLALIGSKGNSTQLYVRAIDRARADAVPGTEGASSPSFSPERAWIGFFAGTTLKKVATAGGPVVTIAERPAGAPAPLGLDWLSSETIMFCVPGDGLWQVPAAGGSPRHLIPLDRPKGERNLFSPHPLPGGKAILFTMRVGSVIGWEKSAVVAQSLERGERKVVVQGASDGRYVAPGHLVYLKNGMLMAAAFDPNRLETTGTPVPLLEGVIRQIGRSHPHRRLPVALAFPHRHSQSLVRRIDRVDPSGRTASRPCQTFTTAC